MICLLLMLLLQLLTPFWWWIMLVPLVYGMWAARSVWHGMGVGMVSAGSLWLGASLYNWLSSGQFIADRVAAMLGAGFGWNSVGLLFVLTALVAMVPAGLAGATGYWYRYLFLTAMKSR
ncbi:MAG: hypothetical protein ONB49_13655 [candidate division KSB1 bacterium]|nr:hypothetical protein [candidate division KSB1 bacterium]MDZ7308086.1 hypothetical protein [candidate division KSB1 bacterium]MDZ7354534.1 hypothetical protein [candidate division KSB1 bacterium]